MNRKERLKRNLGGTVSAAVTPFFDGPPHTELRTATILVERVILALLRSEVDRLSKDEDETRRFFSHFFDPTSDEENRERLVKNFMTQPPRTIIGYARSTAELPTYAITLASDEESDEYLDHYVGQTLEGERASEDAEYSGSFFQSSYDIYVLAQHPEVTLYLYHFARACLFATDVWDTYGILDPVLSGGELDPNETYLPDNVYGRILTVRCKSLLSVPKLLSYRDGRKLRVTGIFREDVVVDGVRGGVCTYVPGEDDDD